MKFTLWGREITIRKWALGLIVTALIMVMGGVGFVMSKDNNSVVFEKTAQEEGLNKDVINATPNLPENTNKNGFTNKEEEEGIKVYIVGCVKKPGIVTLKKGQIINDAIAAAGGATQDADLDNINLAFKLSDNVMLKIRSKKENILTEPPKTGQNAPNNSSSKGNTGIKVVADSGGAVVDDTNTGGKNGGKININSASIDELDTLPGVGKETAKDIIAYREKSGKYKTISDIMKVPGIKQNKFDKLKDYINAN